MSNSNTKVEKLIEDLTLFYVRENYLNHLKENNIKKIDDKEIENVVDALYSQRKDHLKTFILSSLKDIMKDEYIGDLFINNILIEIFRDDNLCKNRIILEIRNYQN